MSGDLFEFLFDDAPERHPISVSELNAQVRNALERTFPAVWVEAEIVNFTAARSGHWYFTLNDGTSQIRAACYRGANYRIRFKPFDGLQVRVRGKATLYEPRGEYQLLVDSLEPVGEGALKVAFDQIHSKLAAEGLFETSIKRRLPSLPRRIGVVTSPTGAAFWDIMHVLTRRAGSVSVVLIPTLVQGEFAGEQICRAISQANEYSASCGAADALDVLIVGRGGGAAEDLWAFNEEQVARAIRASAIPVISAVGHEVDLTIADLVADLRAATPSAAAELVAASEEDLKARIARLEAALQQAVQIGLLHARTELQSLETAPGFTEFPRRLNERERSVENLADRMAAAVSDRLTTVKTRLQNAADRLSPLNVATRLSDVRVRLATLEQRNSTAALDALHRAEMRLENTAVTLNAISPLAVLGRGFSIATDTEGRILRNAADVSPGERIRLRLNEGRIDAEVISNGGSF